MRVLSLSLLLDLPIHVIGTDFLDRDQLLANVEDRNWFEHNVPLLGIPDQQIQDVSYYRWQLYKEHLVYTGPQYGYMSSEFVHPVGYGAPYGGVVAAAGHHINEGRWLRDVKYGQDLVNYWLSGPGQLSKPMTEDLNKDTSDWAHQYSFWAASSVWRQYLVTGDRDFVVGQLDNLVKQYRGWDSHFDPSLGLYWQIPVWDATENTTASYESDDPYHGGAGFRPTINAYQYGDARAISSIAALKGDTNLSSEYDDRADKLQKALQEHLWDSEADFFKHRACDNNPSGALLSTREIMGYVPWMFNMPSNESYMGAFAQLKDPRGFSSKFGPTSAERRSKWFMYEAQRCCRWNGPSWPYATSQTLAAVENVLNDYPAQHYITSSDYYMPLQRYAATQYRDGKPYVAEAHDPDEAVWIYDDHNRSEDYNHSTFVDNVLAGLLGLRAQWDNKLVINPLIPSSWDYFGLENVAYHGHSVTILWDRTGSHYGQGKGLRVYVDDQLTSSRDTLGSLEIDVGPASYQSDAFLINIAANTQNFPQFTKAFASYTFYGDDAARVIDGLVCRTGIPEDSRWTSYNSSNLEDFIGVDLRRNHLISDVRLFFYDDGSDVRIPSSYDLQYWTGSKWLTIPDQQRSAKPTASNAETKITFPAITTTRFRVVAPNPGIGKGWGLSEFQIWAPAVFQIRNEKSGRAMGVGRRSTAKSQQPEGDSTPDHLWEFVPSRGGWWKIKNSKSRLLLAVEDGSTAEGSHLLQHDDNDTDDQLWRVHSEGGDLFSIENKRSQMLVGIDCMSRDNGARIVQCQRSETTRKESLWSLLPATSGGYSKYTCIFLPVLKMLWSPLYRYLIIALLIL